MATPGLFEDALAAEGITGRLADLARSIYSQESGSGRNTKTSNAGAVGGMQIIPSTFASMADKGWDINDPMHNARAGIRYIREMDKAAGGDPLLAAVGYYGGPGAIAKARNGVAVNDPRNPNAPNTLQYGQQVVARMPNGAPVSTPVAAPVVMASALPESPVQAPAATPMMGYVAPQAGADKPQVQAAAQEAPGLPSFNVKAPEYSMKELSALMNNHVTPNFKTFGKWGKV